MMKKMSEPPPSPIAPTMLTDLDVDSLAHCASYVSLQDVSNLAMSSKYLKKAVYSDAVWVHRFREHWPHVELPSSSVTSGGVRQAYLARHTALHQFNFPDPSVADFYVEPRHFDHILLDRNHIFFSQGSSLNMLSTDSFSCGWVSPSILNGHNARITSMRLFPLSETSLFRSETQRAENVLVTSSCDHSIRLWWKGACQKSFKSCNRAVTALSDKLLGDDDVKVLASGEEDGTVRLWSLSSRGRGQHALKATLYGHEKPVTLISVAEHKSSLLVTISKDSKVRVWDGNTSSASQSSCCVGMNFVSGTVVGMKCHEALLYVAAGSSVVTIDLRTMRKVNSTAVDRQELLSFAILPSKCLFCVGGSDKAMLWDVRRSQETPKAKPEPVAVLNGHKGPVTLLHMDTYKIVTGGLKDSYVKSWEADTGKETNSMLSCWPEDIKNASGCSAMAVNGRRIVTGCRGACLGIVRFRDFNNATYPVCCGHENESSSKFWASDSDSDSNTSDSGED